MGSINNTLLNKKKTYLIDGFPRNLNNYIGWQTVMSNITLNIGTIHITCEKVKFYINQ